MKKSKTDIILAGVGGQGILSIAAVLGLAAVAEGFLLKQAEVHGMSQRGGAVQSHLRLSAGEIASDLIPMGSADLIISLEPMEALRYLPYLHKDGWLISNSTPFINIPNYPPEKDLYKKIRELPHQLILDADSMAREAGSPKSSNMIILGAASPFLHVTTNRLEQAIQGIFDRKGAAVVDANIKAFNIGRAFTQSQNRLS